MGRKRVPGLDWLELENTNQRFWALEYLRAKGFESLFHHREKIRPNEIPSHKEMLAAGMNIELEAGARELFGDMKHAWRQEKDRKKKKDSDRHVCAFSFSSTTKIRLQEMAKEKATNATALLETLITKAHKAHVLKQQKQRPKQTLQGDRVYTIEGLHEQFVGSLGKAEDSTLLERAITDESISKPGPPEQQLVGHTQKAPDEKAAVPSQESVIAAENEAPLEQEGTAASLPNSMCLNQAPATSTGEAEQENPKGACPEPIESPPHARTEPQTNLWKMRLQNQKRRRAIRDSLLQQIQRSMPHDELARYQDDALPKPEPYQD
ncbi:hypothetical protein [Pseudomonas sp. O11]|uniref:hypothetical protein n=1 Tax=Pseudomonas sp. O11 TaxID=3159446 RepID=UPI00387B9851